jgi:hypothetical protein
MAFCPPSLLDRRGGRLARSMHIACGPQFATVPNGGPVRRLLHCTTVIGSELF